MVGLSGWPLFLQRFGFKNKCVIVQATVFLSLLDFEIESEVTCVRKKRACAV